MERAAALPTASSPSPTEAQVLLLLLCGLPAAGKSSLARQLQLEWSEQGESTSGNESGEEKKANCLLTLLSLICCFLACSQCPSLAMCMC